ncbi:hypothetical protein GLW07_13435 [Bacillus hwajinpoensis]|uniref:Uncharacterized protein n=1 Tax=Guptibacillus hwajinpoensis TaxID=208199 RepID=A0A845F0T2_9BACL|nr:MULTISPECIES: hypothetical protein [Bacillaceae]MYL64354.1 hypothetical protein [Pseudalkalibacillus hwajinpoensis]QHA91107.1 hypothetical protein GNK04_06565 [Bacillus sp. N1-1]
MIRGNVNGEAAFSMDMDNSLNVIAISEAAGFPEDKAECKEKVCDY